MTAESILPQPIQDAVDALMGTTSDERSTMAAARSGGDGSSTSVGASASAAGSGDAQASNLTVTGR